MKAAIKFTEQPQQFPILMKHKSVLDSENFFLFLNENTALVVYVGSYFIKPFELRYEINIENFSIVVPGYQIELSNTEDTETLPKIMETRAGGFILLTESGPGVMLLSKSQDIENGDIIHNPETLLKLFDTNKTIILSNTAQGYNPIELSHPDPDR